MQLYHLSKYPVLLIKKGMMPPILTELFKRHYYGVKILIAYAIIMLENMFNLISLELSISSRFFRDKSLQQKDFDVKSTGI